MNRDEQGCVAHPSDKPERIARGAQGWRKGLMHVVSDERTKHKSPYGVATLSSPTPSPTPSTGAAPTKLACDGVIANLRERRCDPPSMRRRRRALNAEAVSSDEECPTRASAHGPRRRQATGVALHRSSHDGVLYCTQWPWVTIVAFESLRSRMYVCLSDEGVDRASHPMSPSKTCDTGAPPDRTCDLHAQQLLQIAPRAVTLGLFAYLCGMRYVQFEDEQVMHNEHCELVWWRTSGGLAVNVAMTKACTTPRTRRSCDR